MKSQFENHEHATKIQRFSSSPHVFSKPLREFKSLSRRKRVASSIGLYPEAGWLTDSRLNSVSRPINVGRWNERGAKFSARSRAVRVSSKLDSSLDRNQNSARGVSRAIEGRSSVAADVGAGPPPIINFPFMQRAESRVRASSCKFSQTQRRASGTLVEKLLSVARGNPVKSGTRGGGEENRGESRYAAKWAEKKRTHSLRETHWIYVCILKICDQANLNTKLFSPLAFSPGLLPRVGSPRSIEPRPLIFTENAFLIDFSVFARHRVYAE